jgi:acyl-CoA reductase-like NAD-dependent aldehyde dehydrogenase
VIFTKDWEAGMRIGEAVEVGSYTVNNVEVHHPDLPDSGRKRSGKGFSLSEDSVRNMGKTRAIVI